jgi:hypothetical protein
MLAFGRTSLVVQERKNLDICCVAGNVMDYGILQRRAIFHLQISQELTLLFRLLGY